MLLVMIICSGDDQRGRKFRRGSTLVLEIFQLFCKFQLLFGFLTLILMKLYIPKVRNISNKNAEIPKLNLLSTYQFAAADACCISSLSQHCPLENGWTEFQAAK
jgi:hypothetical protein